MIKIGSVVIDCTEYEPMERFWMAALHYVRRDLSPDDDVLCDPEGRGPNVAMQEVPETRSGKNRLHLDLYTDDPAAEVERLVALGATRFERDAEPGEDFVVLLDPEGNQFCVIDKSGA